MSGFDQFKFNKQLLSAIAELGFENPTEIQEKAIPLAMAGHDVMGIAQTGTGKTASYVLPILMKLKYAQGNDPRALILAPTRELAIQINENIAQFCTYLDIRHMAVYGGVGIKTQIDAIKAKDGIDLLVATPGRLMELYLKGELIFKQLKTLVLDEADRMMDMGFMPQIRKLLEVIPRKRQNLLFSATMPDKVKTLSEEFLEAPMMVEVTPQSTPAETVEQMMYLVPNLKTKINLLLHFLETEEDFSRVLVFTRTKENANNVYKYLLRKLGDDAVRVIHANKAQNTRLNAIEMFKNGDLRILVSTDVSARGIDVNMVSHVVNFDVPILYEDYVHRIGRTGRARQEGKAITFVTDAEVYHIDKIKKLIQMDIQLLEIPEEVTIVKTAFAESQDIARAIDQQKKKENPDFKGAFHEKKRRPAKKTNKSSKPKKSGGKKR